MYKISVPITIDVLDRVGCEPILRELRKLDAARIMISVDTYVTDPEKADKLMTSLKKATAFFKEQGLETGAWLWTFWLPGESDYVKMASPSGAVSDVRVCPTDERFRVFAADYLRRIASCGVDFILLDDDYRLGLDPVVDIGCTCPNHRRRMSELLGEDVSEKDLLPYLVQGGPNAYRDAFVKANRESLLLFAHDMRKAVNEIDHSIRIGVCACADVWDFDGADPAEISQALAGDTEPLLRFNGAPYWSALDYWGNRLQDVVEMTRMEKSWIPEGIETMSEGDTSPRPRYATPASFLEGVDTALRADGTLTGILKYALDYTSSPAYEPGFVKAHLKNKPLYAAIDEWFTDKAAVGLRVYEAQHTYTDMVIPEKYASSKEVENLFFPVVTKFVAGSGIPTCYYGEGAGISFGDNVRCVPESVYQKGLILDIRAARILCEKGIDVGIRHIGERFDGVFENFRDSGEKTYFNELVCHKLELDEHAEVLSFYEDKDGIETTPGVFLYTNASGGRFLIYNYDAYNSGRLYYRNYERVRQFVKGYEMLTGHPLPASLEPRFPDCYLLAKESADGKKLAVGVWNFFPDAAEQPVITLADSYSSCRIFGGDGTISGNKLTLPDIPPYGCVVAELTK